MGWEGTPISTSQPESGETPRRIDNGRSDIHTCRYEDFTSNRMGMLPNCPQASKLPHCLMHDGKACNPLASCPGKCIPKSSLFLGSEEYSHKQHCIGKNTKVTYNYYQLPDGTECYKEAS